MGSRRNWIYLEERGREWEGGGWKVQEKITAGKNMHAKMENGMKERAWRQHKCTVQ